LILISKSDYPFVNKGNVCFKLINKFLQVGRELGIAGLRIN